MQLYGVLALDYGYKYELTILKSAAGFYIGTKDNEGMPFSRESVEYFKTEEEALQALSLESWTQKECP